LPTTPPGESGQDRMHEQPERLVFDVRYLYRDRAEDDHGERLGRGCSDSGERRFSLRKDAWASSCSR
jgi:hypothetical protein